MTSDSRYLLNNYSAASDNARRNSLSGLGPLDASQDHLLYTAFGSQDWAPSITVAGGRSTRLTQHVCEWLVLDYLILSPALARLALSWFIKARKLTALFEAIGEDFEAREFLPGELRMEIGMRISALPDDMRTIDLPDVIYSQDPGVGNWFDSRNITRCNKPTLCSPKYVC